MLNKSKIKDNNVIIPARTIPIAKQESAEKSSSVINYRKQYQQKLKEKIQEK